MRLGPPQAAGSLQLPVGQQESAASCGSTDLQHPGSTETGSRDAEMGGCRSSGTREAALTVRGYNAAQQCNRVVLCTTKPDIASRQLLYPVISVLSSIGIGVIRASRRLQTYNDSTLSHSTESEIGCSGIGSS